MADAAKAVIANRNLPLLLLQAREAVMAHFRPLLNHFGLTEQQWRILRGLSDEDGLEPWQICERCQILGPSLTGILSRMEEMGLLRRDRMANDQRRVRVTLTDHGAAMLNAMAPLVSEQYRLLQQAIGADVLAQSFATLDRLLGRIETTSVAQVDLAGVAVPGR